MPGGLSTTWQVLTKSRCAAVTEVLAPLLGASDPDLVARCLRTLMRRRDAAGHEAVIEAFHRFDEATQQVVSELPGRMTTALQNAILGSDSHLLQNALAAIDRLREYDLFPTLTTIAEKSGEQADAAAATLIGLARQLHAELTGDLRPVDRRDPERFRGIALVGLQDSLNRFAKHGRREIMDAFLLLSPRSGKSLSQLVEGPAGTCQEVLLEQLKTSPDPQIMGQLVSMGLRPGAPPKIVEMLGQRGDLPFVQRLLKDIDVQRMDPLRRSLKQLQHIEWIDDEQGVLQHLEGAEEEAAVALVLASGVDRVDAFDFLKRVLTGGKPEGRQAACAGLVDFSGEAANNLVVQALSDESPQVQAEAIKQLRSRAIPGALAHLVRLLDSPHAVVQEAARGSLSEFSFERYRAAFDYLADDTRLTAGGIVRKVDISLTEALRRELLSLARTRRIRAIEMSTACGTVEDVEQELIENLRDEDHFIRSAAAWALGRSTTTASRAALQSALGDRSFAVQEAAREGLSQSPGGKNAPAQGGRQKQ